jgi:hypothetical protein
MNAQQVTNPYKELIRSFTQNDYQLVSDFSRIDECVESIKLNLSLSGSTKVVPVRQAETNKIYFAVNNEINPFQVATENGKGGFSLYDLTFEAYDRAGF